MHHFLFIQRHYQIHSIIPWTKSPDILLGISHDILLGISPDILLGISPCSDSWYTNWNFKYSGFHRLWNFKYSGFLQNSQLFFSWRLELVYPERDHWNIPCWISGASVLWLFSPSFNAAEILYLVITLCILQIYFSL